MIRALEPEVPEEIAAHLDAAIQARLELGEAPDEAVRNAVAVMGAPTLVKDERSIATRRVVQASTAFAIYAPLYLLLLPFAFFTDVVHGEFFPLYGLVGIGLTVWMVGASVHQERITPKRFWPAALAAGLGVWLVLGFAWIDMGREGSTGVAPRWKAAWIREIRLSRMHDRSSRDFPRTTQSDIDALDAAVSRTPAERLNAELPNGAMTAAALWAALAFANLVGVSLGRIASKFRRRRVRA